MIFKIIKGLYTFTLVMVAIVLSVWLVINLFDDGQQNLSNCELIKTGMSFEEVNRIMGKPSEIVNSQYSGSSRTLYFDAPFLADDDIKILLDSSDRVIKVVCSK